MQEQHPPPSLIARASKRFNAEGRSATEETRTLPRTGRPRKDWRAGAGSVPGRDGQLLAFAMASALCGVLVARIAPVIDEPWGSPATLAPVWVGLAVPVVLLFFIARPVRLVRFRATDVVWGLGLGLALRFAQGVVERADLQPFPTVQSVGGPFSATWWIEQALVAGIVGPVVEEFFFRGVILVVVYRLLRRAVGPWAASVTAVLSSAGTFVLVHQAFAFLSVAAAVQILLVGAVCGALVLATGRIWGAVLTHLVYNVTFLLLTVLGSYAG